MSEFLFVRPSVLVNDAQRIQSRAGLPFFPISASGRTFSRGDPQLKLRNLSHRPVTATVVIDCLSESRTRSHRKGNVHVVVATIERKANLRRRMCDADLQDLASCHLVLQVLCRIGFHCASSRKCVWLFKEKRVSGIAPPSKPSTESRPRTRPMASPRPRVS